MGKLKTINNSGPAAKKNRLVRAVELVLTRFYALAHGLTLVPLYAMASICLGLAATPGIFLFHVVLNASATMPAWFKYPALGIAGAAAYFVYGFTLIFLVPVVNLMFGKRLTPSRGSYYSVHAVRWYIHNGLTYLVRYTFLEFITPTPFNTLFFKMMGMKIGKGVHINSGHISDPSLIELGDRVTIGGSATIVAHYGQAGYLVIAPVKIGRKATVGLRATVMGGVTIGEGAKVLPNSVVLPKTEIPAGETWGGVPAQPVKIKRAA